MTNVKKSIGKKFLKVAVYVILIVGVLWVILPFIWMILTAFKSAKEVLSMPPKWIPSSWQWQNFSDALKSVPFRTYLFKLW